MGGNHKWKSLSKVNEEVRPRFLFTLVSYSWQSTAKYLLLEKFPSSFSCVIRVWQSKQLSEVANEYIFFSYQACGLWFYIFAHSFPRGKSASVTSYIPNIPLGQLDIPLKSLSSSHLITGQLDMWDNPPHELLAQTQILKLATNTQQLLE